MTASDKADCAQGGKYSISEISVIYACTILSVGVENVYVLLGLQYCDKTVSALDLSSTASVPQLLRTSTSILDSTSEWTGEDVQMQDWRASRSSLAHRVLIVWRAML